MFVLAGTQSGKTSWGPWWLWREIQRTAKAGEQNDYLAITSSYDLFRKKMLPEMQAVFCRILKIGRYHKSARVIELRDPATGQYWAQTPDDPMWGRILLCSASAPSNLESATAKAAWLDECGQREYSLEIWEAILRRLSLFRGRALGTTTIYDLGWLKVNIYDRWEQGDPTIEVVQFDSTENPAFSREEFEERQASMPAWRFNMMYRGLFTRPAGAIYDCYVDEIGGHVVKDFPLPPFWPRQVGTDFGAVNTALVWVAEQPETGLFYAYRESHGGGQSSPEHAAGALELAAAENVIGWYGGSPSETQQRMDWGAAGVAMVQPYVADVEGGIDRVYALLKTRRLYVFESCRELRSNLLNYKRKLDKEGLPTDEIADK
ncbi:MAG: terminase large subunit domain-containing protein, partial [Actinomycetota bacterium]